MTSDARHGRQRAVGAAGVRFGAGARALGSPRGRLVARGPPVLAGRTIRRVRKLGVRMALGPRAPERRRRLIVDAALDVLRERGFAGARMADIASRAGTSPALVAYHFGTLSAVLSEALTVAEDKFYADLDHLLAAESSAREQ